MLLCGLAVLAAARGLVRHNTWYLASDQFAFLTFADDLTRGRLFHDPTTFALLATPSLPPDAAVDAYYQTYIFSDGRLFSRYPPGYPLLLAAAKLAGGETAQHWLNPLLYLVLMAVLGRLAARLADGQAPWAAAATTMWTMLVIPVEVHYWGITVARDLPAHLLALMALLAARSAAPVRTGLLLGFAGAIRPDAVLWGLPAAIAFPRDVRTVRAVVLGSVAFGIGLLPLFGYNAVTLGHPLAFTQGSEFRGALESAVVAPSLLAGASFVSGGAFRLVHFPATFPVHARYLAASFGGFLWLAGGMFLIPSVRRLSIARALAAYVVIGLLFYSCWSHGDPRYLVGVSLSLIVLASGALFRMAQWLAETSVAAYRRLLGLLVACGVLVFGAMVPQDPVRGLTMLERVSAASLVAGAATTVVGARALAPVVPALALAGFGGWRILASGAPGEGFRAADVARARTTIEAMVPQGALVLTSPALGRPAENWTYYTHVDAHYLGELGRVFADANLVAHRCTTTGRPFFLLLAASDQLPFTKVPPTWLHVREIARRSGDALREWFVDPNRARGEVVLYQAKLSVTPQEW